MGSSSTQPPLSNEQGREVHTSVGNCHPRKISIGILPDSSSQSRAKDFAIQTGRAPTRGKPISAKDGKNLKQKEAPEHETSPWISTRSFCHQLPVPEQPHGTGEPTPPVLLSKKPVVEKDNRVHDSKGGATIGVEKVSFATMRFMSKKNVGEHATAKTETKGSETLRMKLWEILGTIAPSNSEHGLDAETKSMSPFQNMVEEHVPAVKLRESSYCLNMEAENMSPLQNSDDKSIPVAKTRNNSYCLHTGAENMSAVQNNEEGSVPGAKLIQNSYHLDLQDINKMQVQDNNAGGVPAMKLGQNSNCRNMEAENTSQFQVTDIEHVPVAKLRQKSSYLNMQAKNKTVLQKDDEEAVPVADPRQNSHCFTVHAKNMSSLQSKDQENVPVAKARQNSDTIEMDSQSPPDVIVGRLRTRSLTRKGAAGSLKESKMENAPSTHPTKGKKGGNNNSVLKEGFSRRLRYGISGGPKTSTRKICERFSAGTGAHILFSDEVENQPANSRNKGMHCHVKSHLQGDIEKSKGVFFQPKRVDLEFDSHMSEHLNKKVSCPKILENVSQAKEKLDDVCPTFGVNLTKEGCYPESLPSKMKEQAKEGSPGTPKKVELGGADNGSPGKPLLSKKGIHSFKSFFSSRSKFVESDTEQEDSPYAVGQFEKSPPMKKSKPVIEEPECRMPLSSSSSEDSDLQTSREAPRAKGFGKSKLIFREVPIVRKSDFVIHLNKKHFFEETVNASELLSSFSSGKVLEEDCNRQPRLDSNEEDGLRSIVSLFALALERVKSNMKSMVKKKCAEILMSAAEGIQLQLQTAESQIQADMVTLNSINKLKRKRVDARFEELQGQLKVLHERYKDDVNRHLQDCRSTVESLEAHQLELKATVEKQCLSHNKLISQAEKAIETQLNDAQKRITEVHNLARKKMSQLKHDVADCF